MLSKSDADTGKGVLLTGDASPLAAIARDLSAVVDALEADCFNDGVVRPETAVRLREIFARAQEIADCVE